MGADLSYVNQILDHGGTYRDSGKIKDPYRIFASHGANVVRLRLFHTPRWTGEIYGEGTRPIYNHFEDVKIAIERARADPHKQNPPKAWESLDLETLRDSIYQYTFQTLEKLEEVSKYVGSFRKNFGKKVMILETAYPWTTGMQKVAGLTLLLLHIFIKQAHLFSPKIFVGRLQDHRYAIEAIILHDFPEGVFS